MKYKVITYYTEKTEYENEFKTKLEPSLKKFNIDYVAYPLPDQHKWVFNCLQKANVILKALNEFKCPVLWIDVDAIVGRPLIFFDTLDKEFDICCYHLKTRYNPNELLSGTLCFNYNALTVQIVKEWIQENNKNSLTWDQRNLQSIVERHKELKILPLPVEYIKIDKFEKFQSRIQSPVITHYRASRRLGRKIH